MPIGYGSRPNNTTYVDQQRGWLNYYLDVPANSLVTRATAAVTSVSAAALTRDPSANPEGGLGPSFPGEVSMTSPTAPGVVRRWTSARAFTDEVSMARIYAGIHYRTSTIVGQTMGRQIGELAVRQYLTPIR